MGRGSKISFSDSQHVAQFLGQKWSATDRIILTCVKVDDSVEPRELFRGQTRRTSRPQEFARPIFFLAVFFRITHEGLTEKGTTRSLASGCTLIMGG